MKRVMIEAVLLLAAMMFGIIIFEGCSGDDDDVADQSAGNDDSGTIDDDLSATDDDYSPDDDTEQGNLVWYDYGSEGPMLYDDATNLCAALGLRLPTLDEIRTIIAYIPNSAIGDCPATDAHPQGECIDDPWLPPQSHFLSSCDGEPYPEEDANQCIGLNGSGYDSYQMPINSYFTSTSILTCPVEGHESALSDDFKWKVECHTGKLSACEIYDEGDPYHTNSARLNVACVTVE